MSQDNFFSLIKQQLDHPIATNVIKIQAYNTNRSRLELDLFEWLIIKAKSFGFKEFHYSVRRISNETYIKRRFIVSCFATLKKLGFYQSATKGHPRTTYHKIDFTGLATKDVLKQIYKEEYVPFVLPFYEDLAKLAKLGKIIELPTRKVEIKSAKKSDTNELLTKLVEELKKTYRSVVWNYNSGKLTGVRPIGSCQIKRIKLHISKEHSEILSELLTSFNYKLYSISNAYKNYLTDKVSSEGYTKNDLTDFLEFDSNANSYPVVAAYVQKYKSRAS